ALGRPVLVKGGHGLGNTVRDALARPNGSGRVFEHPRRDFDALTGHGTGCRLASAIAGGLAQGFPLESAVSDAIGLLLGKR
ncbi:MAG: bifunctional hydroxymethylpyrimidine kinase/phosphomethylpyrimidine kinase, partial [Calditrichaeota bacterium]